MSILDDMYKPKPYSSGADNTPADQAPVTITLPPGDHVGAILEADTLRRQLAIAREALLKIQYEMLTPNTDAVVVRHVSQFVDTALEQIGDAK